MLRRRPERGVARHGIVPGKPQQDGSVHPINGRFGDACLNERPIGGLSAHPRIIEAWQRDVTMTRPRTSLNGLTPTAFATRAASGRPKTRLRRAPALGFDDLPS
jgi:putative transposase